MAWRVGSALVAAALVLATGAASVRAAGPPRATEAYSLSTVVGPGVWSERACRADPACVVAPVPGRDPGADDQPALAAAVASVHAGTVLLARGTYRLGHPLELPPNVNLRGAGMTATTLLLAPQSWRNFGYSFLVRPSRADTVDNVVAGDANEVTDLTVNGSCRIGAGAPDSRVRPALSCDLDASRGYGGGIKAGNHWTIRHVRFTNLNYFKLWVVDTVGVTAVDDRFDNWGGAGASDEDNIGGGGGSRDLTIDHNQWDETVRGNGIDLLNADHVTIRANRIHATPFYLSYRGVGDYGSVILEGVTGSTVADNVFHGAHLAVQSNARYRPAVVTDPRGVTVTGNRFVGSFWAAITVNYDDYDPSAAHRRLPGGMNTISRNTITRPAQSGILVFGREDADKDTPDVIADNVIVDAGWGGSRSYAGFPTAGVGLGIGRGDTVTGNAVLADRSAPGAPAVHIGQASGRTTVVAPDLLGNTGPATQPRLSSATEPGSPGA